MNNKMIILAVAPSNIKGTVFIPLRFIGESVQREVTWNSYWKQVVIADTEEQINMVLIMNAILLSTEDEKGLMWIHKKDSFGYINAVEVIIPNEFQQYDLHYSLPHMLSLEESEPYLIATVSQEITKTDNSDYQDKTSTIRYAFIKENGFWKMDSTFTTSMKYESTPEPTEGTITLSDEQQKSIRQLIDHRILYANEHDVEKLTALYQEDNQGSLDALLSSILHEPFTESIYDVKFISNGIDEAMVKVTILTDYVNGDYYDKYIEYITYVNKDSNGQWKLANIDVASEALLWE